MTLREVARGKPCYLRLEGCTHDASQTVLAHVRRGGIAGVGQKPPDICGFPACDWCHGVFDGRYKAHGYTRTELDAEALRALSGCGVRKSSSWWRHEQHHRPTHPEKDQESNDA